MAFVQMIEYETSDLDAIQQVTGDWVRATEGKRTARRILLGRDRDRPNHVYELVFFDSYESAMENSGLPETKQFAERLSELLGVQPTFRDLEVVDDRQLG